MGQRLKSSHKNVVKYMIRRADFQTWCSYNTCEQKI